MLLYQTKMIRRGMTSCHKLETLHKIKRDNILLVIVIKYHGGYLVINLEIMSEEEGRR